jgi:uncharacterized protein (DUF2126 family)
MLPHFVARDFADVLAQLRQAGYGFDEKWFGAQFEFRFPRIGSISVEGVGLELRHALEPWNVLAEETSSGGTVRSVDSSLERIQVKVSGFTTESRYAVLCNGRRVPLSATDVAGEMVAGVRFRARQLSALLHPTVPVHAPLVFDLVDCWKERSIGRCVYHAVAPSGRVYIARPANAAEAKDRRRERFEVAEPAPGEMTAPEEDVNPNFPLTLDLRMPSVGPRTSMERPGAVR